MAPLYGTKHTMTPKGDQNIAYFRDSQLKFHKIRVVVHTVGRQPNGMSDNHISVFLLLDQGAVRLNMTTEEGYISGDLVWSFEAYQVSNSAITNIDIELGAPMTVATLYERIRFWGLQRYNFSGGGSGCRYWVYCLILRITEMNYIDASWVGTIWNKLSYQYSREVAPQVIQIRQGAFINQEEWEKEYD